MTHPITPPPELVQQWCDPRVTGSIHFSEEDLATRAAQWGADQELEACCEWLMTNRQVLAASALGAARRPKTQSLKEQALDVLHLSFDRGYLKEEAADTIRRALESIDD
jgi:hypothetical protein